MWRHLQCPNQVSTPSAIWCGDSPQFFSITIVLNFSRTVKICNLVKKNCFMYNYSNPSQQNKYNVCLKTIQNSISNWARLLGHWRTLQEEEQFTKNSRREVDRCLHIVILLLHLHLCSLYWCHVTTSSGLEGKTNN